MGPRRVAPAAIVGGESVVWRAEVGCSNEDGRTAGMAPLGVVSALEFKARAASESVIEESCAEGCSLYAISLAIEVTVSTSST